MEYHTIVTDQGYQGINPVQFGYEDCNKGHFYGPAVRTHWLIHFVVSGHGYYRINNKEYKIGPGEMFVIPPFEETFYQADNKKPWTYIWIGFTCDGPLPTDLGDVIRCPEAIEIFNSMKNCDTFDSGKRAYLSAKLWELFALLLRKKKPETHYVQKAIDCIHSEYMQGITVEQIADRLKLDRCYFSTMFKKRMGVSPKQYLTNYRMSIAATLMTDNSTSVTVAACSVGYSDIYNFSKAFKRHFGVSPNEYIKKRLRQ